MGGLACDVRTLVGTGENKIDQELFKNQFLLNDTFPSFRQQYAQAM